MTDVARPAPEVYRLNKERLPFAVGRERRLAAVKVFLAATALIIVARPFASSPRDAADVALGILALALLSLPYVLWRVGQRVRRHWNAFEMSLGSESLRVAAKGEGRVTILLAEVSEVLEDGMGLLVRSTQPGVTVHVPRTMESYLDARARLAAGRPIRARADARAWCLAAVVGGLLGAASAPLWGRVPGLGVGVAASQLAFAFFVGCELGGHPLLGRGARLAAILLVALAGVAPLVSLVRV